MAIFVIQEGPKNLTVLINTGGGSLNVSALNPPCAGLLLTNSQPTPDAAGTVAGPTKTVWTFASSNQDMCFDRFGGIKDGNGNWTVTLTAGIAVLSFDKIRPVNPNPN